MSIIKLYVGDNLISVEDIFDTYRESSIPLSIVRSYSPYIHKRRTMGPVGAGWLLQLWYNYCLHKCVTIWFVS